MSATWILVLLLLGAILARAMRSTKMWWILLFAIMAGLLVGMLSKEATNHITKSNKVASITELISSVDSTDVECTLPIALVTEAMCLSGVVSYVLYPSEILSNELINDYTTNGRNSPAYEDDS